MHPRSKPLIGIHGRQLAGKTEYARMLAKHSGRPVKILPFAKPLKDIARSMGWDGKKDKRGRRLLRVLGTEAGRDYDPETWVRMWRGIAPTELHAHLVVADDLRFLNEFDAVRELGGVLVKIKRKAVEPRRWQRVLYFLLPFLQHRSEVPLPDDLFDLVIENDGSLAQLEQHAVKLVKMFDYYHPEAKTPLGIIRHPQHGDIA